MNQTKPIADLALAEKVKSDYIKAVVEAHYLDSCTPGRDEYNAHLRDSIEAFAKSHGISLWSREYIIQLNETD